MATSYAQHFSTKATPQTEAIPGTKQVENSAGGFSWVVDDWARLDRFLLLGCEGGSYYATERKLTIENAQGVVRCLAADGKRAVARIVEISEAGRAPKNDPAVFCLALAASQGNTETKATALAAVPRVCRIGTHLFQFAESVQAFRGWGRGLRRAVGQWYASKTPQEAAYQLTKYQQRNGWSHRDLLRLSHPKVDEPLSTALRWAVGKADLMSPDLRAESPLITILAFEAAKKATDKKEVVKLIRDYGLVREHISTQFLTEPEVWDALLEKMPLTAMIRNLATMTRIGLIAPMSAAVGKVVGELANVERLRKSRVHPIALLIALKTYQAGRGDKSDKTWVPVQQIVDALDGSFYQAFGNVESTGKRWMLGLDVSGSMASGAVGGIQGLSPRVASAAMALVTAATEPQHVIMGFSNQLVPLNISPRQRLDDAIKVVSSLPFGGTDCALPMVYALANKIPVDVFVTYTDSETWAGPIHAAQALVQYRQKMGLAAKAICVGLVANQYSVLDENDAGSLNIGGFDSAAPQVMAEFVR